MKLFALSIIAHAIWSSIKTLICNLRFIILREVFVITSRIDNPKGVTDFSYNRIIFDVSNGQTVSNENRPVQDDMDFLGGIGHAAPVIAG